MTAHKHAELMMEYAKDAMETDKPWKRWEFKTIYFECWTDCDSNPAWDENIEYRRKPKTININGFEVPEPCREKLEKGQRYYIPYINDYEFSLECMWDNAHFDKIFFEKGLIHLTKENAILHAKALLSFTLKEDD